MCARTILAVANHLHNLIELVELEKKINEISHLVILYIKKNICRVLVFMNLFNTMNI
jgi:hypothetical protein